MNDRGEQLMVDEALIREGDAWVLLMTSGAATHADADALRLWRQRSPAHERAFCEAVRLRDTVRTAATELRAEEAGAVARSAVLPMRPRGLSRRAVLSGAVAASAAGAAVFVGGRSLGLWPGSRRADFATAKGERRTIRLASGVSAELNTATRLSRRPDIGAHGLELLDGEVMLVAALSPTDDPLVALAGSGRAIARRARFSLRCDGSDVAVTCLEGAVMVEVGGERRAVPPSHRLTYSNDGLGSLAAVDPAVVTAWQQGALVFHQEPLRNVIAEINRYRPGRIMIASEALGDRRIDGTFYVAQLDEIFEQVRSAFGARVTRLPGGVVVLA
jgi:transmembrane sensor